MTNILNFPAPHEPEVINEEHFEQFSDAALLLKCFEGIADAAGVVEEGAGISLHDETHVGLIEVCMALAVLFRRRTGHAVQVVSADHLEMQRQALMEGELLKSLPIPIRPPAMKPLPAMAFSGVANLDLAQAGFNYAHRVSELISGNCPQLVELDLARAHAVDAMTACSQLIARLSGVVPQGSSGFPQAVTGPSSETLQ